MISFFHLIISWNARLFWTINNIIGVKLRRIVWIKNTNFPLREVGLKVQIPLEISWIERDVPLDADICEFNLTPETEKNDKSGKNICKYSFKFYRIFFGLSDIILWERNYVFTKCCDKKSFVRSGIRTHALIRGPEISDYWERYIPWVWRLRPLGHSDILLNVKSILINFKIQNSNW